MAYQVLARKWRPQEFSSLIGQEPIVTALRNALTEGRVAQAYLFSGIRGVGKTTAARLLAKALNCEKGPAADPCNQCVACREITAGADLDVIEVDAATYSKVEQVRELTESLRYGPARDRYKVVVLDEVHRLSRQAFDALLKIVEEPPPYLVFIFATTEIEAVPATMLSRCQEFHFRRVPALTVAAHLGQLASAEGIQASDTALRLVARAGEGSVRDSVALLDQLATFGSRVISDDEAARLLGGLDTAIFHQLLVSVLAGSAGEISAVVQRIEDEGWDPRHAYAQFLSLCRDALHLAMAGAAAQIDLPQEAKSALAQVASEAGYENLLRLMQQLLASESFVRRSENGALALEVAWLRAAELPKLIRVEEILGGGGGASERKALVPSSPASTSARSTAPEQPARSQKMTVPAALAPPSDEEGPDGSDPGPHPPWEVTVPPDAPSRQIARSADRAAPSSGTPTDALRAFVDEVSRRKQPLAAHLGAADALAYEAGELLIYSPPGDSWLATALARESNREVLEAAIARTWGEGARWRLVEGVSHSTSEPSAPEDESRSDPIVETPIVQRVLDIFGGTVQTIERHDTGTED